METYICGHHICSEKPIVRHESMHSHNLYEIYCFLEGHADYCVEGNRYSLQHGDIMIMRKGEVHVIRLLSAARYERMYVHFDITAVLESIEQPDLLSMFDNRPLGKLNHYPAALFPNNHWIEYLSKICGTEDKHRQLCFLLPLLRDLADGMDVVHKSAPSAEYNRIAPLMKYINSNLSTDLSLDILAKQFYLSKTHLNRLFKHATGTTAGKYVTIKRLFLAKELIESGKQPTEIYHQCGFSEYSTFFRSYKQYFGVSPKHHGVIQSK